jgi:DNA-binding NtrC family response regulator
MANTDDAGPHTLDDDDVSVERRGPPAPGLVVIHVGDEPMCRPIPTGARPVELGRAESEDADEHHFFDPRMSRRHALVAFRRGDGGAPWIVRDLDSRNGTFVDGVRVRGEQRFESPRVLRMGSVLAIFTEDTPPFVTGVRSNADAVVGPRLRRSLDGIRRAASLHDALLIRGESGSGKELAARTFHEAGPLETGPFVAVNCATVPHGLAERLLFGARKGAYSGAVADAQGYIEAADKGVLFLDEIGELELEVQAKLLRFLETKEFVPLGATRPHRADVRIVFATHRNLRAAVAAGSFRADLYYRIGVLEAVLPPLRDRLEEIPWLIAKGLQGVPDVRSVRTSFIHDCLLRPWPGNVRELLGAVRRAVYAAQMDGVTELRREHLDKDAGAAMEDMAVRPRTSPTAKHAPSTATLRPPQDSRPAEPTSENAPPESPDALRRRLEELERQRIIDALTRAVGNQTETAKLLGIARRTLIHRMDAYRIPRPRKMGEDAGID